MEEQEKKNKLLSVEDLSVDYVTKDETVTAVSNAYLSLDRGETLGLVGETGAGKTTIARSILRILPIPPAVLEGGKVFFDGLDLYALEEEEMRKIRGGRISMVFQDPMTALNPVQRVGNQIAEGIQIHEGLSKKEALEKAIEMLKLVGISPDRYREYPHQFSGGMKQRVVLAIALACKPDLLIADEPTSALDVTIQAQIMDTINDMKRQQNTSMILITHDFGVVAESCDKVAVIYAGQIIETGTIRQVFERPMHPYTVGLFGSIPTLTSDVDRLSPIPGSPPDPTNLPVGCRFADRCPHVMNQCLEGVKTCTLADGHQCMCNLFIDESVAESVAPGAAIEAPADAAAHA